MLQIRYGVFETNSSSTHTLTICTTDEFQRFAEGEMVYDYDHDTLVDKKDVEKLLQEEGREPSEIEQHLRYINGEPAKWYFMKRFLTLEEFADDEYMSYYSKEFTTPSGDKMLIFGKYGHD